MKETSFNTQSGISLLEVLIVLVITAILVTFAVAQLGKSKASLQRQNVARELKVNFERARFDSVKRRAADVDKRAGVKVYETDFDVTTDLNLSGLLEESDTRNIDFGSGTDIQIVSPGLTLPVTVKFDQRGQITATDASGAAVTPKFIVCNDCTASTANAQNANVISISPTGTIVMTAFGEAEPNFLNPIVTDVGSGSEIKPLVAYSANSGATGTTASPTPIPTPTLTPTPTPTPSPNSTPTPTQTPPPTPVPTPTPKTCTRNQRPAQDNCVCNGQGMSVRNNGKCQ